MRAVLTDCGVKLSSTAEILCGLYGVCREGTPCVA